MANNKIKTILISQPEPQSEKSPYFDLAKKYGIKIDFVPFIHVEPVGAQDFRQERISIMEHTAVILTSKHAVDHFFRMCEEMRVIVADSMKYFCISEAVAFYLQHHIVYRKRKIFVGKVRFADLMEIIKKHRQDRFLLPCSDLLKVTIPELLEQENVQGSKSGAE